MISSEKEKISIIKIGGKLLDNPLRLKFFLDLLAQWKGKKILVHGGGSEASRFSQQLGIEPQMINGRRITSEKDIQIVTMVYAGWLNKKLVTALQMRNCNALGLSGADGNVILAEKRPVKDIDYGFVGDVKKVRADFLQLLLKQDITPVLNAITHDGKGNLLNTNADTIAAETAIAMSRFFEITLIYCFEKQGVLTDVEDENSVIPEMNKTLYQQMKETGQIHQGMLPKLHTGFDALQRGVHRVFIGNETILQGKNTLFTQLKQ